MPPMPAGHRDAEALSFADRLTKAAEEMRRKATHKETVREVDRSELDVLRGEVDKLRAILVEIGAAVDAELKRRA